MRANLCVSLIAYHVIHHEDVRQEYRYRTTREKYLNISHLSTE